MVYDDRSDDVQGLHHVGHVVQDMGEAMERYRRLGFTVPAPAYPVLPREPGGPAEPFGVANTHVYFSGAFVELVAVLPESGGRALDGARPIPLRVPDDKLPGLVAAVRATAANITSFLRRFQGLHIMIADTRDLDRVAARLTGDGVSHGGVHAVQRPVETSSGTRMEPARYLEISDPELGAGRVPEGRIGFAENAPSDGLDQQRQTEHPNGATGLVECVLCVPDAELAELTRRYTTYYGPPETAGTRYDETRYDETRHDETRHDGMASDMAAPQPDRTHIDRAHIDQASFDRTGFDQAHFDRAGVTVVSVSALAELLPGERPAVLPAFVAYAVSVRDVVATERFLRGNDIPVVRTGDGELFVPAHAALGTAIIFRQQ
ncbi:VOC family protein [Nonomuraea antri]|uniref:VOC family protein n=1 Tax=Nonomuraea antri TaxID=2730852 RepID=UPI001F2FB367|nr:VOC family protein [Nonomuraea antri]